MGSKDASPDPWSIILLKCNSFLYVIHFNLLCIKNENIELNTYVYTVCVYLYTLPFLGWREEGGEREVSFYMTDIKKKQTFFFPEMKHNG